eukprot:6452752-Amphidinium_carterae.1
MTPCVQPGHRGALHVTDGQKWRRCCSAFPWPSRPPNGQGGGTHPEEVELSSSATVQACPHGDSRKSNSRVDHVWLPFGIAPMLEEPLWLSDADHSMGLLLRQYSTGSSNEHVWSPVSQSYMAAYLVNR